MTKTTLSIIAIIVVALALGLYNSRENNYMNTGKGNMETKFEITSPAFSLGEFIGAKYTCDELNISPPLKVSGVPKEAKSLVLIMDDPDVPEQVRPEKMFDHWVVYNIPPSDAFYDEGHLEGTLGLNGRGEAKYTGPCPPTQYEPTTHRYFFKLYATDLPVLNFVKAPTKSEVLFAIEGHVVAEVELMGRYDRLKTIREND